MEERVEQYLFEKPDAAPSSSNEWPNLKSDIIYPLLAGNGDNNYPQFIHDYYRAVCAIVDTKTNVVIGTGVKYDKLHVLTARHILADKNVDDLLAVFFKFESTTVTDSSFRVTETNYELTVTGSKNIGTDAVLLETPLLSELQFPAVDFVPVESGDFTLIDCSLGFQTVSKGTLHASMFTPLVQGIRVGEDFVGSSGAPIFTTVNDKVVVSGINICRFGKRKSEHRILSISKVLKPSEEPIPEIDLDHVEGEGNLEFVVYDPSQPRVKKVNAKDYKVLPGHSCHHIIPIRGMQFLWDYFHEIAPNVEQEIKDKVAEDSSLEYDDEVDKKLQELYGNQLTVLEKLVLENKRQFFAWATWNLFKGWNSRSDDPGNTNEKVKPLSFDADVWNGVQQLYTVDMKLQKASQEEPVDEELLAKLEKEITGILTTIHDAWVKLPNQGVHAFDSNDWELENGKYHLKLEE